MGRSGEKYRKVNPPSQLEIWGGVGWPTSYVFNDPVSGVGGKMVWYDGFLPEVSRTLSKTRRDGDPAAGSGLQPRIAEPRGRLCESPYLVSRTIGPFGPMDDLGRLTGHDGRHHWRGPRSGESVAIAEVDLGEPIAWQKPG